MTPKQLASVAKFCNRYPMIEVSYQLADENVEPGESATLMVLLQRETDDEELPPVDAARYPKRKEEGWWVVLGDPASNQLYAIKRVTGFVKSANTKLEFTVQEGGSYKLFVMCDSYLGCDQEFEVQIGAGGGARGKDRMEE